MTTTDTVIFASPVDTAVHGDYRIVRNPDDPRPLYRFDGRIRADGSTPFAPDAGRYHIYSGWFCPWAQRVVITRSLSRLEDVISLSYVDGRRDGRGWAFRQPYGPDPVNAFPLLRQAYDATEPDFDGHVSVPTLWDRSTGTVSSNQFRSIGIDLATQFQHLAVPVIETYPAHLAQEIDALDEWIGPAINQGAHLAAGDGKENLEARARLLDALADIDRRLADQRYLVGDTITEADIRLWVTLVRFDVGPNARRQIVGGLEVFPNVWGYARDLYTVPAFRSSTDLLSFSQPGATVPAWHEPTDRAQLAGAASG